MEEFLWIEKWRPNTVKETVLPESIKSIFQGFVDSGNVPNLLLSGKPGVGKTTVAKSMLRELECDYIIINCSLDRNIDTLRNEILQFASSMSFQGGRKYVILDECLDENTLVSVYREGREQLIKIKDLDDKNDLVKSFNIKTEKIEWKPFELFDKNIQDVYELEFENEEKVICTEDHKWYVLDEKNNPILVKTRNLENYKYILTEKDYLNWKKIQPDQIQQEV